MAVELEGEGPADTGGAGESRLLTLRALIDSHETWGRKLAENYFPYGFPTFGLRAIRESVLEMIEKGKVPLDFPCREHVVILLADTVLCAFTERYTELLREQTDQLSERLLDMTDRRRGA